MEDQAEALEARELTPVKQNPPAAATPMTLIQAAIEANADVDKLEKLLAMQERWEANQGRKEFDKAISAAKAEIPAIIKNRTGHNNKRYADFSAIAKVVDPVLSKHGLSYRFRTSQTDNQIHVTCILSHEAGHSEETTLAGPADTTGNKNNIQAIGSTLTYLQRYSLVQALGLAASEDDDGAAAGAGEPISEEQVDQIIALCDETGANKADFLKWLSNQARRDLGGIPDIPASLYQVAIDALERKRKK